ncbi:MAG: potassium transporter TrkA, partial [Myxococcota bacterium]
PMSTPPAPSPTWRQRFRYEFDNVMAHGAVAQLGMLALLSVGMIVLTAAVLLLSGLGAADGEARSFPMLVWMSLMRAMDAGAIGGDSGPWAYLFVNLGITLGGIFVLSTLIGVLNGGIEGLLEELRKGRSLVVERDHVILLGFTPKVPRLLLELAEANKNRAGACVVLLADRDKVEMDDELREILGDTKLKVVTRSGSPLSPPDLAIVNPGAARAVIVLAPEGEESEAEADTVVLKTLLALTHLTMDRRPHLVAELKAASTLDVARMVVGPDAALVLSPPLISRLLVQTGRQSGLSAVYTELLDFAGNEIYMVPQPDLVGRRFRDAVLDYDSSSVIGVLRADGATLLGPWDHVFGPGDQLIAISDDDDTVKRDGHASVDPTAIAPAPAAHPAAPERTLLLGGASPRAVHVLRELDNYVGPGSVTVVVGEGEPPAIGGLARMTVEARSGDATDRSLLDALQPTGFDHVLALAETDGRSHEMADARTMVTLLHLRDIARKAGKNVPITSEMLDIENQRLAAVAEADDFIVSNTLISLILAQLAENPRLVRVFDELFTADGHEVYLRPVGDYVKLGVPVDFYTVTAAAADRRHVAIGYRLAAEARDPDRAFGVVVNPTKGDRRSYAADDRIVVLATDG